MRDKSEIHLSASKVFKLRFFGLTEEVYGSYPFTKPQYQGLEESVDEVVRSGSVLANKSCDAARLFREVTSHIPRRVKGRPNGRVQMYVAVGRTSLDAYHSIAAFFLWREAMVSIDVSQVFKTSRGGWVEPSHG